MSIGEVVIKCAALYFVMYLCDSQFIQFLHQILCVEETMFWANDMNEFFRDLRGTTLLYKYVMWTNFEEF